MNLNRALFLLVLAAIPEVAAAGWAVDGKADVRFEAQGHPGALDFEGRTSELLAQEHEGSIVIRVPLAHLETGIELRDEHMKEKYLEVDTYPFAVLKVPADAVELPAEKGGRNEGTVQGTFSVHGVDQPVEVHYSIKRTGSGWSVKGEFDFDISKHGIDVPSYLGVTVEPQMHATAKFKLVEQQ